MRRQRKGNKDALETKRIRDTIPHTNRQNYIKEPGREKREWQKAEGTDKEKSLQRLVADSTSPGSPLWVIWVL